MWKKEKVNPKFKYEHHDIHLEDISDYDMMMIKSNAVGRFMHTREGSQVPLIIGGFMDYLAANGYRIIKKEEEK